MYCKKCGASIDCESIFCSHCGYKVENEKKERKKVYCTYCGKKIYEDDLICSHCGKKTEKAVPNSLDQESVLFDCLAFLIPVLGFLLWIVMKEQTPIKANRILQFATIGFIFWFIIKIL